MTVKTYRAYALSPRGKIVRGEWIDARDLDEACAKALEMCDPGCGAIEIWQGAERLAAMDCSTKAAEA